MNIFKILTVAQFREFKGSGVFTGAPIDLEDGYIHFSTGDQLRETLHRHFSAETQLVIVAVNAEQFDQHLKWEASRGGQLFPHLYTSLSLNQIVRKTEIQREATERWLDINLVDQETGNC